MVIRKNTTLRDWIPLVEIATSLGVAAAVITFGFSQKKSYEDFDLGTGTSSYFARQNDVTIHTNNPDSTFIEGVEELIANNSKDVLLILGNSQTHGINQFEAGQTNYIGLAVNRYESQVQVIGHSIPNANLQELYLLFQFWTDRIHVSTLVLPIFYDDLREDNVREHFFKYMTSAGLHCRGDSPIATKLNQCLKSIHQNSSEQSNSPAVKFESLQELTELKLNEYLSSQFDIWRNRSTLRGEFEIFRYRLRNTVFGITPQSKRSVISTIANDNMQSLEMLLELAQDLKVEVLLYIPPLRQDVEPPYDLMQYSEFKEQIQKLSHLYDNVRFLDLDGIVPGQFWGMKDSTNLFGRSEYDFMHFQYEGHVKLLEALVPTLDELIYSSDL
ncbi:MAG: hypothetical protein ABL921_34865 [Pirellula sp.]